MLGRSVIESLPQGLLIPHYILASYCYYQQDLSPMTDEAFDYLCVRIKDEWDFIEHQHKPLVEYEALSAGSCFLKEADYPTIVKVGYLGYYTRAISGALELDLKHSRPAPKRISRRTRIAAPAKSTETEASTSRRVRRTKPAKR